MPTPISENITIPSSFRIKVFNAYLKVMRSQGMRINSYGLYQLAMLNAESFAIQNLYKFDDNGVTESSLHLYLGLFQIVILYGLGGYAGYHLGKHHNAIEAGEENMSPNRIVRYTPSILAAEMGFMTGLQMYAFTAPHVINNLLVNRILMTASGLIGAILSGKFTPDERSWASFILPRLNSEISKASLSEFSFLRKVIKYSTLVIPSVRAANMLNFTVMCLSSTSGKFNTAYNFGIYTNIIGLGLGSLNLAAFLNSKRYLGENNKNIMSYLAHSAYISLGLAALIFVIMLLVGDSKDINKVDLGGWLYGIIPAALILGGAMPYDQHRIQLNARDEVLREHAQRAEGQEMERLEAGASNSDTSTDESDASLGTIPPESIIDDILIDMPAQPEPVAQKSRYSPRFLNGKSSTVTVEEVPIETPNGVVKITCISGNKNSFLASRREQTKNDSLRQPLLEGEFKL